MTNIQLLRDRYQTMDWQQQLGNLASTMARISTRATSPQHDSLTADLLREAALQVEWTAPRVSPEFLLELAALQREVLAWQRTWPLDAARSLLSLHARHQSDRLLQIAGLIG